MKNDSKKVAKKVAKKVPKKVSKRAAKKVAKPAKVAKHKYTRSAPKAEYIADINTDSSADNPADNPAEGNNAMYRGDQIRMTLDDLFMPTVPRFSGGEHFVMNAETKASNQRIKVINAIRELVEATLEMRKSTERSAGELAIASAEQATAAVKVEVALDAFEAVIRGTPSEG